MTAITPSLPQHLPPGRAFASRLALGVFLLRVLIPLGCMPAAIGTGWFLELCPQGLTPAVMAVLHPGHDSGIHAADLTTAVSGDAHALHSGFATGAPPSESVPDRAQTAQPQHCSMATLLCIAVAESPTLAARFSVAAAIRAPARASAPPTRPLASFQARAPPIV